MTLTSELTIDLDAIAANWRALDRLAGPAETAAVVKGDAYGLGAAAVAPVLSKAGARRFFVAQPGEGAALRAILGAGPEICVLAGFPVAGEARSEARQALPPTHSAPAGPPPHPEAALFAESDLVPVLNAPEQVAAWRAAGGGRHVLQLDTGMNRLGLEASELAALGLAADCALVMSHLACADLPGHPQTPAQLAAFRAMAAAHAVPLSLAATGGILLGEAYRFDLVRPGVGLYGGLPFEAAEPVVTLALPILQVRDVAPGETVGYGATWTATRPSRIATLSGGYADGLLRALSGRGRAWVGEVACPFAGRVSMDLIGLDVTEAPGARVGSMAEILGPRQGVDVLAEAAGTIGYEILTSLGARYVRRYRGG
ncbi:MAG: alanine racemase [Pseudomonadota bacterium]